MKIKPTDFINLLDIGSDIHVFVVTGGPCSGKTTGMARLSKRLSDRGYKVIVVPEAATLAILAGVFHGEGHISNGEFQEAILEFILMQEEWFLSLAVKYRDAGNKVVVLCDRGTMDGQAYIDDFEFEKIVERLGFTFAELCDHRYHAVFHLRTAADGAPDFYTVDNNPARTEGLEQARAIDGWTQDAWRRHRHLRVIDNSTGFDGKMQRLLDEVLAVLGEFSP